MKLASCLLAVLLALPLAASATIYKWTDERGTTVLSNKPPAAAAKVSDVQVVVQDDDTPAAAPKPDNGNVLQERVRALEQQVQALKAPPSYPGQLPPAGYYPPPDYQPAPPDYQSAYAPMYGYGYPYYPYVASYVVVAPRRFFRPHGFGGHRFGVRPAPVTHALGFTHRR